jgi:putative MATE family efflux protein
MVSNALYNLVDAAFIGRLGTSAIGAVAIAFPLAQVIVGVGLVFGLGAASVISRRIGAGDRESASRTAVLAITSAVLLGLVVAALGLTFLDPVLRLFGATESILPFATEYMGTLMFAAPVLTLRMSLNHITRSEGNARLAMAGMLTGALLNIALDPLFIFALGLGIRGAALATVVSQTVAVLIYASYFFSGRSLLQLTLRGFRFDRALYGEVIKLGGPAFLRQLLGSAAFALLNNAAASYGDVAVAVVGISFRVLFLGMFPIFGFGQGFQPVIGYNYGAASYRRVFAALRTALLWTSGFTVLFTISIQLFAPRIISLFTADPQVLELGTYAIRAFHAVFPIFGAIVVFNVLFQALGKAAPAAIVGVSRQGLFLLPAVLLLPLFFGLEGLFFTQAAADLCTGALALVLGTRLVRRLRTEAAQRGVAA